ncbi:MAG: clostripain-related cysteine peptidase [Chloroflexota bacterium]
MLVFVLLSQFRVRYERVLAAQGDITTIVGNGPLGLGAGGLDGDNGPAIGAKINSASGVTVDSSGNIFIADHYNHRIRKVDGVTGVITTVVGIGPTGELNGRYGGDDALAISARINHPCDITTDTNGNFYFSDYANYRIRRVDGETGIITTVAGIGVRAHSGDNGFAINARVGQTCGIALDNSGNLFFTDSDHHRVRKVNLNTGIITTVAGNGIRGYSGNGGAATNAQLNTPMDVALDKYGNIFIAEYHNHVIRKVDTETGIISTVAGTGVGGYDGEGIATSVRLNGPHGVAVDNNDNIFIADRNNLRIRKVDATTNIMTNIAGNGTVGYSGDNGPALNAQFAYPNNLAIDNDGNLLVTDYHNSRIRKVEGVAAVKHTPTPTPTSTPNKNFDCRRVIEIPQVECEALVTLYNTTGGSSWTNNTGWLQSEMPCSWYGVICGDDRVTALLLFSNGLAGSIPPEIGNLSNLRTFELEFNSLTGDIPRELGDLSNLGTLRLDSNLMTGSIPSELGNLSNLDTLFLSNNSLTGHIPPEIGNLSLLKDLRLGNNSLTGGIPLEIGNLSNLKVNLNLSKNSLTGSIPPELGNLTNLELLLLNDTSLTGSIPPELGNLINLNWLFLYNNQFEGALPSSFVNLTNFGHFRFHNTNICEPQDEVMQTWLNQFDQSYQTNQACPSVCNNVTEIPMAECRALESLYNNTNGPNWTDNIGWLETITPCDWFGINCAQGKVSTLSLSNNQLVGTIPPELGDFSSLTLLSLQSNPLRGAIPPELGNLSSLTSLYLSGSELTGSIPPEIGDLSNLTDLNLIFNELTGNIPPELGRLSNLTRMSLIGNGLTGSIPAELGSLSSLKTLFLTQNKLTGNIPPELNHLSNLTHLGLTSNELTGGIPPELGNLSNLISLQLGKNPLSGNIPDSLYNLNLDTFSFLTTDLCEPTTYEFQSWLNSIPNLQRTNIPCQLNVIKRVSTEVVSPNETVTYQIVVTTTNKTTIQLTDTLPIGVNINSLSNGAVYNSQNHQIRYTGSISQTQPLTLTYEATLDDNLPAGSILQNIVVVTGSGKMAEDTATVVVPDPDPVANTLLLIYAVGDNNLYDDMLDALNRAETAAQNPNVDVLMLLDGDGPNDTYLYQLAHDTNRNCPSPTNITCNGRYTLGQNLWQWRDNTASPYTLSEFIQTGIRTYPNADRIILSLIGHGAGWAPNTTYVQPPIVDIQPDPLGGLLLDNHPMPHSLSTRALGKAFQWAYEATGKMIDLVYFDACSMGMWEVAYEVSPYVGYQMFSANTAWAAFPYDQHIKAIDAEKSVVDIGKAWIQNEVNALDGKYPFTFAMVDSTKLDAIQSALKHVSDALIQELYNDVATTRTKLRATFDTTERFESNYDGYINEYDNYGDLSSFANALAQQFPNLSNQATQLQTAINDAVIAQQHGSGRPWVYFQKPPYPPNSVWTWDQIGGIGLYLPFNQEHDEWRRQFYTGSHVKTAQTGTWDELIAAFWDGLDAAQQRTSRTNDTPPICPPDCDGMGAPLNLMPTLMMPAQVQTTYQQSVTIPLELDHYGNAVTQGEFTVQFDDACLAVDPAKIEFVDGTGAVTMQGVNQIVLTGIQSSNAATLQNGQLVNMPVTIICEPSTGTSITTSVTITNATFTDDQAETISGTATDSVIAIRRESTEGDINGDEAVNIFDLQILINMITHHTPADPALYPLDQWQRAELNGDGVWNIFDLQLLINLITQ